MESKLMLAARPIHRDIPGVELLLIRHAQPAWVVDGKSELDPRLTKLGHRQTEKLAHRLASLKDKPTTLLMSPTTRTRQTAGPLAQALGVAPQTVDELREIEMNPDWAGQPAEAVGTTLRAIKGRPPDEWWTGLPGGEPYQTFHERVVRELEDILRARGFEPAPPLWSGPERDERLVFVTHGGTNAVLLGHLLGLPAVPWAWERFVTRHASVTRLRLGPLMGGLMFGLRELSDVDHLEGKERTR
ncbi:MAG: histidine phosphatase family protein [Myxococcota bacterium]